MNRIYCGLALVFLTCTQLLAQVEKITWRGWPDCYRIKNKQCEVIIGASCGGRVLSFSLNGKNIIFENVSQNGKTLNDWRIKPFDPDGGRFDYGPERTTQSTHSLTWMGAWSAEIIDDYTVRLTSAADTTLGMLSIREFRLHADSAVLMIKQTGTNITNYPLVRHFWGRTLVKPGGILVLPVQPRSRFEHGWGRYLWNPDRIESPDSTDERIKIDHKTFRFHAVGPTLKGGTDADDGWMAYAVNGLLFIKRFIVYKGQDYSGSDRMTGIFYSNGTFTEIEPCSPTYIIQPNSSVSFLERWELEVVPNQVISHL